MSTWALLAHSHGRDWGMEDSYRDWVQLSTRRPKAGEEIERLGGDSGGAVRILALWSSILVGGTRKRKALSWFLDAMRNSWPLPNGDIGLLTFAIGVDPNILMVAQLRPGRFYLVTDNPKKTDHGPQEPKKTFSGSLSQRPSTGLLILPQGHPKLAEKKKAEQPLRQHMRPATRQRRAFMVANNISIPQDSYTGTTACSRATKGRSVSPILQM
ncbi:hypothetical protein L218DRAFT_951601 [Marasmius fiardii PR-910]|nr:hypothetical protein L218DRAFT_951601 [Marasmius fiardii PR-910]